MLKKTAKLPSFSTRLKTLGALALAVELVFCGISYYYFRRMNRDIDYRKKMLVKSPTILELFYKAGEAIPFGEKSTARQDDYAAWGITKK